MKTPNWFLKKDIIALSLLPLSILYFIVSQFVFIFRHFWQKDSKIPVICVGGLLAGGVGKTPIVQEIAKKINTAIVMRGYRGGDEAKMLKRSGLSVITGSNRIQSIKKAKKSGFKLVVMDDGFQNPTIKKDVSILVFNSEIGIGNGFVLPAGPLREPLYTINRADAIIITGKNPSILKRKFEKYNKPIFFAKNKTIIPKEVRKFIAFAGIGYPQKFFNSLSISPIKTFSFPDHYNYTNNDVKKLLLLAEKNKAKLLTTEKDWVRLSSNVRKQIYFAQLETIISPEFYFWLEQKLASKK